jgi:hypothetical protein
MESPKCLLNPPCTQVGIVIMALGLRHAFDYEYATGSASLYTVLIRLKRIHASPLKKLRVSTRTFTYIYFSAIYPFDFPYEPYALLSTLTHKQSFALSFSCRSTAGSAC